MNRRRRRAEVAPKNPVERNGDGGPPPCMKEVYPLSAPEVGVSEDGTTVVLTMHVPLPRKEIAFIIPAEIFREMAAVGLAPHIERATPEQAANVVAALDDDPMTPGRLVKP